ncbi:MAG TPA: hemagglutinin repeat-containing protein [Candidatus Paceibacterota bacterium]
MNQPLNRESILFNPGSRRSIAWLTLLVYIGYPLAATAQVAADAAASAQKRPVIDTTANGIPLVQITTPNASGVSHNQYTQYNVDPSGLILNNSATNVLTQQAGYVPGNQNLVNGSARIILNEVTGTSISQLNGYTEVAGQKAEVIIANPNGISCNGCGFINTSRGVLTTGTAVFGGSGSLDSFRVTGGEINIGSSGLNAGDTSQLDLIARSVKVNGELWANDLNVITGTNLVNYANLGVQVIAGDANKPTVGIDVAQLGGMYANKIRLIGTEAGVGVNSQGNIATKAGDIVIDNQGQLTLAGTTSAGGNLNINSATGIQNTGTLQSQQSILLTSQGDLTNSGSIYALGNLTAEAANITSSGNMGAGVDSVGNVVPGVTLTLNATAPIGAITNSGRIAADNMASNSYAFTNTGTIFGGNVTLAAYNLDNLGSNAYIGASRVVNLKVANTLTNYDTLLETEDAANPSASRATIYSMGDINIGSSFDSSGNPIGNTASVINSSGNIEAGNTLRINADQITNKRTVVGVEWGASWDGAQVVGTNGTGGAMGDPTYTPTYRDQQFTATTTARAKMVSGGDMLLSGGSLLNDYSDIIAGGTLTTLMSGTVTNNGAPFQREETRVGQYHYQAWGVVGGYDDCGWSGCHWAYIYGWVNVTTPYTYGPVYTDITGPQSALGGGSASANVGAMAAISVPTSGPFSIQPQPNQNYLVVTNPQFTNYQTFVSSDYMLDRLVMDPGMIQKRLGDGFYEQKLVADQILQATGKRNLAGFSNIQSSYQALMDEALVESKDLKLIPGVALNTDQIAALRHDIVWMVAEDVKLPDGSVVKALAPKVYFSQSSQMRLNQGGALIAANEITMQTGGVLDNHGRIISDTATNLIVGDLVNHGAVQSGGALYLQSANDVSNLSGTLAGRDVQVIAGRDINDQRVSDESGLHQQGDIIAANSLNMAAGRNLTMAGGGVQTGGNANLVAGGKVDIGVLETHNSNRGGNNSYIDTTTNLGSTLDIGGNLAVQSGKNMTFTAATLNAGGSMTLLSGGDLDIKAAKDTRSSGYSSEINQARNYDEAVKGSALTAGGNLILAATSRSGEEDKKGEEKEGRSTGHSINLESATLASNNGKLALVADNNINIGVTEEKHSAYFATHEENNGRFYSKSTDQRTLSQQTYAIGSELSGESVLLQAGKPGKDDHGRDGNINVVGSSIAGTGDVTLQAANDVRIQAATSTSSTSSYSHTSESGLMSNGGLSITIGEREQTDKYDSNSTLQSQNRSLVGSTSGNLSIKAGGNALIAGSDLVAANDLNVEAQDITVNSGFDQTTATQSHDVHQSGLTISLSSNVTTAAQTVNQMRELGKQTQNKRTQALAAATAALTMGNAFNVGPSVSVSATVGSSDSHSDSTQTSKSSSGSMLNAGGNINLTARAAKEEDGAGKGGNLTIQGSDVKAGNDINLTADRDIRLLAEQNTYSQVSHNSSSSSGAGVSVSYGSGGGTYGYTVNAATAHGNADGRDISYTNTHLSAANALNIKSGGDTTLRGATASGKQVAADIGGNLAVESLQDTSTYGSQQRGEGGSITFGPASGASINASQSHINSDYASVIEQSGIQAGDDGYRINAKGNTDLKGAVIAASDAGLNRSSFKTGGTLTQSDINNRANYDAEATSFSVGVGGNGPSASAGEGSDSGSAADTTKSGVGVSIKSNTSGKVDRIFDAARVSEEINAQVQITQSFSQQATKAIGDYAQHKLEEAKQKFAKANDPNNGLSNDQRAQLLADAQSLNASWGETGASRLGLHVLAGALGGGVDGAAGAGVAGLSTPAIAAEINQLDLPMEVKQALILAASTAVGQAAGGQAGGNAAIAEVGNNFLAHTQQLKREELRKKVDKGTATPADASELRAIEFADQNSDYLFWKGRADPNSLSDKQKSELAGYLSSYANLAGPEKYNQLMGPQALMSGAFTSYGFPYAAVQDAKDAYLEDHPLGLSDYWNGRNVDRNENLYNKAASLQAVYDYHQIEADVGNPALMFVDGPIGVAANLTAIAGGSYKAGQGMAAIQNGEYGTGFMDLGIGTLTVISGSAAFSTSLVKFDNNTSAPKLDAATASSKFQGDYPYYGIDQLTNISLPDGGQIVQLTHTTDGVPIGSYFTTLEALESSRLADGTYDANALNQGLQTYPGSRQNFRAYAQIYEVTDEIPHGGVAMGPTTANPYFNPGGYPSLDQMYLLPEFRNNLMPLQLITLSNTRTPTYAPMSEITNNMLKLDTQ